MSPAKSRERERERERENVRILFDQLPEMLDPIVCLLAGVQRAHLLLREDRDRVRDDTCFRAFVVNRTWAHYHDRVARLSPSMRTHFNGDGTLCDLVQGCGYLLTHYSFGEDSRGIATDVDEWLDSSSFTAAELTSARFSPRELEGYGEAQAAFLPQWRLSATTSQLPTQCLPLL